MKNKKKFFLIVFSLFLLELGFSAQIDVPDFETRIKQSGQEVPNIALPNLDKPSLSEPPIIYIEIKDENPKEESNIEINNEIDLPLEFNISTLSLDSFINGSFKFAFGFPEAIFASAEINRSLTNENKFPFFAKVWWNKKNESTFLEDYDYVFNSNIGFEFDYLRDISNYPYFKIKYLENEDGLQGENPNYKSIISKSLFMQSYPVSFVNFKKLKSGDLSFLFGIDIGVDYFFADLFQENLYPSNPIKKESAYFLEPKFIFSWDFEKIKMKMLASYFYDVAINNNDFQKVNLGLVTNFLLESLFLESLINFSYDSSLGFLTPFYVFASLGKDSIPNIGESTNFFVSINCGLKDYISGRNTLYEFEPFSELGNETLLAADWYAQINFNLFDSTGLTLSTNVELKRTAFNRNFYKLTGYKKDNGLAEVTTTDYEQILGNANASWKGKNLELGIGYNGYWLDLYDLSYRHLVLANASVFGNGKNPIWFVGANAKFFFAKSEFPFVNLNVNLQMTDGFNFGLDFEDVFSLILNKTRRRNGLYKDSYGNIRLFISIDF